MADVRPIDANALVAAIIEINGCDYGSMFDFYAHMAAKGALNDVVRLIDDAPLLDYAPVKHSEWVKDGGGFTICKECGCSPADWEAKPDNPSGHPPYCHSCGAKMDGGQADE